MLVELDTIRDEMCQMLVELAVSDAGRVRCVNTIRVRCVRHY